MASLPIRHIVLWDEQDEECPSDKDELPDGHASHLSWRLPQRPGHVQFDDGNRL